MGEYTVKAIWNMDEAALKRIDFFLNTAEIQFMKWDLEGLYWTLRAIRREINAKLKQEEKKDIDEETKELEIWRKNFLENKNLGGDFFAFCEEYYMMLNFLMKKHGLFFREGDDPRYAVLKR